MNRHQSRCSVPFQFSMTAKCIGALLLGHALILTGCAHHQDGGSAFPVNIQKTSVLEMMQRDADQPHDTASMDSLNTLWSQLFRDPTLSELQHDLTHQNLDLTQVWLNVDAAALRYGIANAKLKPQLALHADYSKSAISEHSPLAKLGANTDAYSLFDVGIQAKWELDLAGFLKHQANAAQHQLNVENFQALDLELSLTARLTRHYFLLRHAQRHLTLVRNQSNIQRDILTVYENKYRNGVITADRVSLIKERILDLDQSRYAVENEFEHQVNAMSILLASTPEQLKKRLVEQLEFGNIRHIPIGFNSSLLRHRPDILKAEAQLKASISDVAAAKADFYPRIGISAQMSQQGFKFSELGDWGANQFGIGPILHLPIFEGGRLKKTLALSKTKEKMAAVHYQKVVLQAWHELDLNLSDYQHYIQNDQSIEQQLKHKQHQLKVKQQRFEHGVVDMSEVLEAQNELLILQIKQLNNETAKRLSIVGIARALGGGVKAWSKDATMGEQHDYSS